MLEDILAEIDAEIAHLQAAKAILSSVISVATNTATRKRGRPAKPMTPDAKPVAKRSGMSAEARERIRQGQVKRWAAKKATKPNLNATVAPLQKPKKSIKSAA